MKKNTQRTLCSILFASLVTTQLSGMLSTVAKTNDKKSLIQTIKKPFVKKSDENKQNFKDGKNKSLFKLDTLEKKYTSLTLSLIKKNRYQKEENYEEKSESNYKFKQNSQLTAIASLGVVGLFFYKNRDKFALKLHAQDISGLGDLKPVVEQGIQNSRVIVETTASAAALEYLAIVCPPIATVVAIVAGAYIGYEIATEMRNSEKTSSESLSDRVIDSYDRSGFNIIYQDEDILVFQDRNNGGKTITLDLNTGKAVQSGFIPIIEKKPSKSSNSSKKKNDELDEVRMKKINEARSKRYLKDKEGNLIATLKVNEDGSWTNESRKFLINLMKETKQKNRIDGKTTSTNTNQSTSNTSSSDTKKEVDAILDKIHDQISNNPKNDGLSEEDEAFIDYLDEINLDAIIKEQQQKKQLEGSTSSTSSTSTELKTESNVNINNLSENISKAMSTEAGKKLLLPSILFASAIIGSFVKNAKGKDVVNSESPSTTDEGEDIDGDSDSTTTSSTSTTDEGNETWRRFHHEAPDNSAEAFREKFPFVYDPNNVSEAPLTGDKGVVANIGRTVNSLTTSIKDLWNWTSTEDIKKRQEIEKQERNKKSEQEMLDILSDNEKREEYFKFMMDLMQHNSLNKIRIKINGSPLPHATTEKYLEELNEHIKTNGKDRDISEVIQEFVKPIVRKNFEKVVDIETKKGTLNPEDLTKYSQEEKEQLLLEFKKNNGKISIKQIQEQLKLQCNIPPKDPKKDKKDDEDKEKRKTTKMEKSEFFKLEEIQKNYEQVRDGVYRLKKGAKGIKGLEKAKYIKWDYLHNEVEAYASDKVGSHLGAFNPETLEWLKKVADITRGVFN